MNSYHNTLISNSDNGKTKFNENDEETLSQWVTILFSALTRIATQRIFAP